VPRTVRLPHHSLVAYEIATQLLAVVAESKIADVRLRDQALRAAKSACLNIAEAAGRASRADQARVFTIARGEACEAAAAVEIGAITGHCSRESSGRANQLANRLVGLLTGLIRPRGNPAPEPKNPNPKPRT